MRCASVSSIKHPNRGAPLRDRPHIGSPLGNLYDRFLASRGLPIDYSTSAGRSQLEQLRNFYGLDIRRVGRSRWVLAGEWFGRVYVDYIAERIGDA
jgi:hypothetical protein